MIASIATALVVYSMMSCVNTPFQYTTQISVEKMPAAFFGPVLLATSQITMVLAHAEKYPPISHEKCSKVHVHDML